MSAQQYEALHVVPPLTQNHVKMAWLLRAREAARTALDAALSVPRKAAGYVSQMIHKLHLDSAASWLRRSLARTAKPLLAAIGRFGGTGVLAGVASVVTSPTGQAVLRTTARWIGRGLGWIARKVYSAVDQGLRCFGSAGNTAADRLFSAVISVGGRVAMIAAPVVHRVARFSDPAGPASRLLGGLSRSYLLHRVLRALISNPVVRLLTEAVLVPAVLDSRLVAWLRTLLRQAHTRAQELRDQDDLVAALDRDDVQWRQRKAAQEADVDTLIPSNRAERRAAQRQGKRPQH